MNGKPRNRLCICPECGGKLGFDRNAVTSDSGFIYRTRLCRICGTVVHTKQAPENVCSIFSVNTE